MNQLVKSAPYKGTVCTGCMKLIPEDVSYLRLEVSRYGQKRYDGLLGLNFCAKCTTSEKP